MSCPPSCMDSSMDRWSPAMYVEYTRVCVCAFFSSFRRLVSMQKDFGALHHSVWFLDITTVEASSSSARVKGGGKDGRFVASLRFTRGSPEILTESPG